MSCTGGEEESKDGQEATGTTGRRKRPGRPRKLQKPSGEPVPKRPRGRPKGSKNKETSKEATKGSEVSGKKRRRGRPRKWPQQVVPRTSAQEQVEEGEEGGGGGGEEAAD